MTRHHEIQYIGFVWKHIFCPNQMLIIQRSKDKLSNEPHNVHKFMNLNSSWLLYRISYFSSKFLCLQTGWTSENLMINCWIWPFKFLNPQGLVAFLLLTTICFHLQGTTSSTTEITRRWSIMGSLMHQQTQQPAKPTTIKIKESVKTSSQTTITMPTFQDPVWDLIKVFQIFCTFMSCRKMSLSCHKMAQSIPFSKNLEPRKENCTLQCVFAFKLAIRVIFMHFRGWALESWTSGLCSSFC